MGDIRFAEFENVFHMISDSRQFLMLALKITERSSYPAKDLSGNDPISINLLLNLFSQCPCFLKKDLFELLGIKSFAEISKNCCKISQKS